MLAQASTPTHEGYLQFLAESKKVYDTLEHIVDEASHPECKTCCLHLAAHAPHIVKHLLWLIQLRGPCSVNMKGSCDS